MSSDDVSNAEIMSTLSQFANEVTERFEKIDDRFEKIDDRFEKIDKRFEHIDSRFEKIDKRFDKMFVYNEQRFSAIEKHSRIWPQKTTSDASNL
ncbi:hypothetical protein IPF89_00575 [Candidatus Saccharibacteria bacterium]|nr:MAG: hypothetical protein IPF89_00575 [Candidatus Saccharibacteria bacterium]